MVEIKPFKATILNPKLGDRDGMVCPVYDSIDAAGYEGYSAKKNNVIHFTTRKEGTGEDEFVNYAKRSIDRFFDDGILVEREKASFYVYGIRYRLSQEIMEQIPEADRRGTYFALGLVALVRVEELNEHGISGHEKTFEVNTRERYHLMRECGMNFSPIVAEYNMPTHDINNALEDYLGFHRPDLRIGEHRKPIMDVVLNGARHLLWELSDKKIIGEIQELMRGKKILILDGHHRYAASYRLSGDREPYTLMMLLDGEDRNVLLLPWHRCMKKCRMGELWKRIEANFVVERYDKGGSGAKGGSYDKSKSADRRKDDVKIVCSKLNEREHEFGVKLGMYDGEKLYLLRADKKRTIEMAENRGELVGLDSIILQEWLIDPTLIGKPEDIVLTPSPGDAIEKVDMGAYRVAFFLRSMTIADVEYKARVERKKFPQKSTRFLPKVAEGVVMRKFPQD